MLAHLYILASKINGTLYIGTTINLINRLQQHRSDVSRSFTAKYNVHRLVHVETFPHIVEARRREVQLKRWKRQWKIELIEGFNPSWRDLADDL
ncbi:MAG: GIY-YIG nuclease family protein [Alphaproteobacteria bacterium]|nr:GIY-YIG nuclease family protein [Alphaproteobacteria bacterium]